MAGEPSASGTRHSCFQFKRLAASEVRRTGHEAAPPEVDHPRVGENARATNTAIELEEAWAGVLIDEARREETAKHVMRASYNWERGDAGIVDVDGRTHQDRSVQAAA